MSIVEITTTPRVVIIGNGGHARVCLEILQNMPLCVLIGVVSSQTAVDGGLPLEHLGLDTDIAATMSCHGATHAFIAIGDNAARIHMAQRCDDIGLSLLTAISSNATISPSALIGDGTLVCPAAVINAAARVGRNVIVNTHASVEHDCVVGNGAHIAPASTLAGGVTIGEGAFIGMGARVLPGLSIGAGAIVGAGAVVTRSVPDATTVIGVPARATTRVVR